MTEITLCAATDISDGVSKGFQVDSKTAVFAVGYDGAVFVYLNECPHLGVNLDWQEDQFLDGDGQLIECSTHGALFEMDTGHCITGPCQGDSLTAIPHRIENGMVLIESP